VATSQLVQEAIRYPRLIKRVRAVLIDSIIMPICAIGTLLLGTHLGVSAPLAKFALLAGPLLVLDPVLVTLTGATIGHRLVGLQVTRLDGVRRLGILRAIFRFAIKIVLGWTSFILVLTTRRHQALHDLIVHSIVTYRDPAHVPAHERLTERVAEGVEYVYPGRLRRLVMIVVCLTLLFVALTLLAEAIAGQNCYEFNQCTAPQTIVMLMLSVLLLVGTGSVIVLGWNGFLWGARKRALKP
jgi:uncharacterized RDD family membrane protein YckC